MSTSSSDAGPMSDPASFGDPMPAGFSVIEVHVAEPAQMLDAIDPSPFGERDLAPSVEAFIVRRAKELPRAAPLGLVIHVDRPVPEREAVVLRDAIHMHFGERADAARRRLGELLQRGRISLAIGLVFLALVLGASQLIAKWMDPGGVFDVVRESLSIGGWVAMWRPMEILLYDWWPIRFEARLHDRLGAMPVRIRNDVASNA